MNLPPPLPCLLPNPRCPYCGGLCWVDIPPDVPAAALTAYPLSQCPTCPAGQASDERRYGLNYSLMRSLTDLWVPESIAEAAEQARQRYPGAAVDAFAEPGGFVALAVRGEEIHIVRWLSCRAESLPQPHR